MSRWVNRSSAGLSGVSRARDCFPRRRFWEWRERLQDMRRWAATADDVMRVANTYIKLAGAALVEYLPAQDNTPEFSSEQIIEELYDAQANTEVMDRAPETAPEDHKEFSFHPSRT